MQTTWVRLSCLALVMLASCSKPSGGESAGGSGAPSASASTAASGASSAAAPSASAGAAAAKQHFSGKYTSSAGTIFVPDGGEWSGTKWRGDDSNEGLGDGELSLDVQGTHVQGSLGGPLGPAVLEGTLDGEHVAAHIDRHDPKDGGFTGTLEGTLSAGSIKGTMHLSRATANVIRQATFELAAGK